jgi:hypothetical protein
VDNEVKGVLNSIDKTSFRELSDVWLFCEEYFNKGYIDQQRFKKYKDLITNSIDDIGFEVSVGEGGEFYGIRADVDIDGKSFKLIAEASDTPVSATEYETLNQYRNGENVFTYQGKLYSYIQPNVIVPIDRVVPKAQGKGSNVHEKAMYEIIAKYIYEYDN